MPKPGSAATYGAAKNTSPRWTGLERARCFAALFSSRAAGALLESLRAAAAGRRQTRGLQALRGGPAGHVDTRSRSAARLNKANRIKASKTLLPRRCSVCSARIPDALY